MVTTRSLVSFSLLPFPCLSFRHGHSDLFTSAFVHTPTQTQSQTPIEACFFFFKFLVALESCFLQEVLSHCAMQATSEGARLTFSLFILFIFCISEEKQQLLKFTAGCTSDVSGNGSLLSALASLSQYCFFPFVLPLSLRPLPLISSACWGNLCFCAVVCVCRCVYQISCRVSLFLNLCLLSFWLVLFYFFSFCNCLFSF